MKKLAILQLSLFLTGCAATIERQSPGAAGAALSQQTAAQKGVSCPPCVCLSTPAVQPGACPAGGAQAKAEAAPAVLSVAPGDIPSFADLDDKSSLLKAAGLNMKYFQSLKTPGIPYSFGQRKINTDTLAASTSEFMKILSEAKDQAEFDRRLKDTFDIYQLAGRDSTGTVIFSSYYEPTLEASLRSTDEYKYPIYAKPDDLISVNLEDFNEKFKGETINGRLMNNSLVPYLSREEIDFNNALAGKGLELAWFKNRADVLDLQTEGSGRLRLPDGRVIKANFAATNSLKFKGWLTGMIEAGALAREGISSEKGQKYLDEHPDQVRSLLSMNKRYVFFKLEQPADPEEGPAGTYGLPLTGWRSVAVDNSLLPMGTLAFMRATTPDVDEKGALLGRKQDARFVFCQDTGGAIKGPGRVDFFAGNGDKAHTFAFKLWDPGALYLLVLKNSGQ